MLTVSLHGVRIFAAKGVYKEEHTVENEFEVDVDIEAPATDVQEVPFIDYTIIHETITIAFQQPHDLLEHFIRDMHTMLKEKFPGSGKIKVVIKKVNPPMPGEVAYARVGYEG